MLCRGDAKATFGSGTSVLLNIGRDLELPTCGAVAALAWVLDGQPTYAWEGLINYSAATIAWLRDQLQLIDSPADTEQIAAEVANTEGVYLVPAFAGLSAPHWRPDAKAAIVGMTAFTRRAHVVRAALESIAFQVHDVLEMLATSGVRPGSLCVDGGPTRNALLMQMVADIGQMELVSTSIPESSALGAAMAGLLGLGQVSSLEALADLPRERTTYVPRMSEQSAAALRAGWQAAVESVLSARI
jgi:glycerol kinase